jgi:hypothetical protein
MRPGFAWIERECLPIRCLRASKVAACEQQLALRAMVKEVAGPIDSARSIAGSESARRLAV